MCLRSQADHRTATPPTTNTIPAITAERRECFDWFSATRATLYFAHGPDGHTHLIKRTTEADALRDGLTYFLATRELDANGRWVLR